MKLTILDFETTGLDPRQSEILEVGAIKIVVDPDTCDWKIDTSLSFLVKPSKPIPREIVDLTKITDEMVIDKKPWDEEWRRLADFLGTDPIVAHHSKLESAFLEEHLTPRVGGTTYDVYNSIDAFAFALPEYASHSLESIRSYAQINNESAHRAYQDVLDLEAGLRWLKTSVVPERPWLQTLSGAALDAWWWNWLFKSPQSDVKYSSSSSRCGALKKLFDIPFQGTLGGNKESSAQPQAAPDFERPRATDIEEVFQESRREAQIDMATHISATLFEGGSLAIEAPTGTGKSLGYLIPAMLAAPTHEHPIVIATHTRSLQDQLMQKDLPRARSMVESMKGPLAAPKSAFLKGQNNYPCLRKLWLNLESAMSFALSEPSGEARERVFSFALITSFVCATRGEAQSTAKPTDLSRMSAYLQYEIPGMQNALEAITSMKSTTIGEKCEFFKSCHYFGAYREASRSGLLITNHALLVRWPELLPKPRHMIIDEAHHLERELTETLTHEISEENLYRWLGQIQKEASLFIRDSEKMKPLLEEVQSTQRALKELHLWVQRFVPSGRDHFVLTQAHAESVIQLKNPLQNSIRNIYEILKSNPYTSDSLRGVQEKFEAVLESLTKLDTLSDEFSFKQDLRTMQWNQRERTFTLKIEPILLDMAGQDLFKDVRSFVLTSATFEKSRNEVPLFKRLGLKNSVLLKTLPSPFQLEKQAQVWIPRDFPPPNSQLHLDRLIEVSSEIAATLGGRTLLLMAARSRIDYAVPRLSERLSSRGIKVLNGTRDRLAQERFRENPKALLVGSEAYGEGLDLPGSQLVCLILEKINEAMVRGPLHDARRALYKNPLFEYDFPKRMNWLKQRMGRLIRTPSDRGVIVLLDSRYYQWSQGSQEFVHQTVFPMALKDIPSQEIPLEIERLKL